ncbi:MAG: FliM/FliN family flagellar motor switch protein [Candidatus Acidiferrales bacterium]
MEKVLNQEEIDQLFRAAQGQTAKASTAGRARTVKNCDFRESGQLTKEQVRQVTSLHDTFAQNLANSLGAYLRVAFQTSLVGVEQLPYSEFLSRLPELTYLCSCLLQPAEEFAALQLDLPIVFPIIDLLLGGPGQGIEEPRDLTEIEEHIIESIVELICRQLQATWQPVLPLEFKMGQRERQASIMTMMQPTERVFNLNFEIRISETRGSFNLVFPAVVSNMLLRKLMEQGMTQRRRSSADNTNRLRELLLDCEFTVGLELPHIPVLIREVVDMQPKQVLQLRHPLREPMSIAVNGQSIFSGVPVSCGSSCGGLVRGLAAEPAPLEKGNS